MNESYSAKSKSVNAHPAERISANGVGAINGEVFEKSLLIRESYLDSFGHVNNAAYLIFLEEARWDIVHHRGFSLKDVQDKQMGPTILDVRLQYRREIRLRETVVIRTQLIGKKGKIMFLRQMVFKESGEVACIADFSVGLFDLKQRKLIEPTPEFKYAIGMREESST